MNVESSSVCSCDLSSESERSEAVFYSSSKATWTTLASFSPSWGKLARQMNATSSYKFPLIINLCWGRYKKMKLLLILWGLKNPWCLRARCARWNCVTGYRGHKGVASRIWMWHWHSPMSSNLVNIWGWSNFDLQCKQHKVAFLNPKLLYSGSSQISFIDLVVIVVVLVSAYLLG